MKAKFIPPRFDELIEKLVENGADVEHVAKRTIQKCAYHTRGIVNTEAQKHSKSGSLINAIDSNIYKTGAYSYCIDVGFSEEKDQEGKLHAVFLNYGTPRRKEHGKIEATYVFRNAFRRAKTKSKKVVTEEIKKLLGE